jgi:hypothetical protein
MKVDEVEGYVDVKRKFVKRSSVRCEEVHPKGRERP